MNLGLFPVLGKPRPDIVQPGDVRVWSVGAVVAILPATLAASINTGSAANTYLVQKTGLYKLRLGNTPSGGSTSLTVGFYKIPAGLPMISSNAILAFSTVWDWSVANNISVLIYLQQNDRVYLAVDPLVSGLETWAPATYLGVSAAS
jgi:hypothetical protein